MRLDGRERGASTVAGSKELYLRNQSRLQTLKAGGTEITSVVLVKGAPVETLILPATLTTLRLENLINL